jgi:hypothetical protein
MNYVEVCTSLIHFCLLSVAGLSVFSAGVCRCHHINGDSVDQNLSTPTSSMLSGRGVCRSSSTKPGYTARTSQRTNVVAEPSTSIITCRRPYRLSVGVRGPHQKTHCRLLLPMDQTTPTTVREIIVPARAPPRAGRPRPSGFFADTTVWPAMRRHLIGHFLFQYFAFDLNLRNHFKFQTLLLNDPDLGKNAN